MGSSPAHNYRTPPMDTHMTPQLIPSSKSFAAPRFCATIRSYTSVSTQLFKKKGEVCQVAHHEGCERVYMF